MRANPAHFARFVTVATFVTAGCVVVAGCPGAPPDVDAGTSDDGGVPDAGIPDVDELYALEDEGDIVALAGEGGAVKYLAPVAGAPATPPIDRCVFQNTARFPFHLPYLVQLDGGEDLTFDDYIAFVLRRDTRRWWGGEVLWHATDVHPITNAPGVLVFTLYTEDSPGNRLVADDVRAVYAILHESAPGFADALAFAPSSTEQRATALTIRAELASEGIAVLVQ